MPNITWVDIALILIILWSVATGVRAGLARVVIGFLATIAAFLVGFWCFGLVAAKLSPWIHNPTFANVTGFLIIFLGILIAGSLLAALLSRLFEWVGLSWFNRFLGGAAGFIRGVLLIAVVVDMLLAFGPSPAPRVLRNSIVVPYVSEVAGWLVNLAPHIVRDPFDRQMQHLRQYWDSRAAKQAQVV